LRLDGHPRIIGRAGTIMIHGQALAVLLVAISAPPEKPPTLGDVPMTRRAGSRSSIDSALDRLYPTETDFRFGLKPGSAGEEPPLAEVVAYRSSKPAPHWHYITYGLTELEEKTSQDPKLSGFGVEYTLRLFDQSDQPPPWPINLLRYLATRTRETREPYDPGHSMNLPSKMLEEVSKGVEGLAFYEDEDLHSIDTPTGHITFVNVIPLMAEEYALIGSWDAHKVAAEIRVLQKDLLWRRDRKSLLKGPRAAAIQAMVEKEGSSQSVDFADVVCDRKQIVLDKVGVLIFEKFLRHRLAHGRDAKIISGQRSTRLEPGKWSFKVSEMSCQIQVPTAEARRLADEISKAADKTVIAREGGLRLLIDRTL
jgi:hypothetical protein